MDILEDLRTTTFSNNEAFFKKAACEIEQLRTENAALKEQVAYLEELNRKLCDKANQLTIMDARAGETITQQAEAIRLKDAALDWCIGEFNLRLDDIDLSQETIRVLSARHIQPSPEHLEAWYKSMVGEPVAWNYELTEEAFVRLSVAGINVDTPLHAIKPFPFKGV